MPSYKFDPHSNIVDSNAWNYVNSEYGEITHLLWWNIGARTKIWKFDRSDGVPHRSKDIELCADAVENNYDWHKWSHIDIMFNIIYCLLLFVWRSEIIITFELYCCKIVHFLAHRKICCLCSLKNMLKLCYRAQQLQRKNNIQAKNVCSIQINCSRVHRKLWLSCCARHNKNVCNVTFIMCCARKYRLNNKNLYLICDCVMLHMIEIIHNLCCSNHFFYVTIINVTYEYGTLCAISPICIYR